MLVEVGCISTNIEYMVQKVILFEGSSFCLSTDINFTSLAVNSV